MGGEIDFVIYIFVIYPKINVAIVDVDMRDEGFPVMGRAACTLALSSVFESQPKIVCRGSSR